MLHLWLLLWIEKVLTLMMAIQWFIVLWEGPICEHIEILIELDTSNLVIDRSITLHMIVAASMGRHQFLLGALLWENFIAF